MYYFSQKKKYNSLNRLYSRRAQSGPVRLTPPTLIKMKREHVQEERGDVQFHVQRKNASPI